MNKVILNIYISSIGKYHKFVIPINLSIREVIYAIVNIVSEEYKGIRFNVENTVLIDMNEYKKLDLNRTCLELKIQNGCKFMMI